MAFALAQGSWPARGRRVRAGPAPGERGARPRPGRKRGPAVAGGCSAPLSSARPRRTPPAWRTRRAVWPAASASARAALTCPAHRTTRTPRSPRGRCLANRATPPPTTVRPSASIPPSCPGIASWAPWSCQRGVRGGEDLPCVPGPSRGPRALSPHHPDLQRRDSPPASPTLSFNLSRGPPPRPQPASLVRPSKGRGRADMACFVSHSGRCGFPEGSAGRPGGVLGRAARRRAAGAGSWLLVPGRSPLQS